MESKWPIYSGRLIAVLLLTLAVCSACMLRDAREQLELIDQVCILEGQVDQSDGDERGLVAVLVPGDAERGRPPEPVDYTLPDGQGRFSFALAPGEYLLMAIRQAPVESESEPVPPARGEAPGRRLHCRAGERLNVGELDFISGDPLGTGAEISLDVNSSLAAEAFESAVSLGQLTAFAEVVALDDSRFDLELAGDSMWRPVDFLQAGRAGVYLAEPFDPERIPVLFIHGINGSPRVLEPLIDALDDQRFQAMYFYYPSGLRIGQTVWHLDRIMRVVEQRHQIDHYHVVAHSMGGLVARAWLLERSADPARGVIGSLITVSTPWDGYPSARQGVAYSPVVVPVWRDMASGSEFLDDLFDPASAAARLPPHHLLFSYRQSSRLAGHSGDGVAALSSMIPENVQQQAASLFGIDAGHVDILSSDSAQRKVRDILATAEAAFY